MRFYTRDHVEQVGRENVRVEETDRGSRSWNLNSFWIYTDPEDYGYAYHAQTDGYWEAWITLWMSNNVPANSVCIDIGANHGYYSFYLASEGCKVYAIEPQPRLCKLMTHAKMDNSSDVTIYDCVISNTHESLMLTVPTHHGMNATISSENVFAPYGTETIEVASTTLDDFSDLGITFIKIDAEGAEHLIWDGGKAFREKNPDCLYLMEWRWDRFAEPEKFAQELLDSHHITHVEFDGTESPLRTVDDFKRREHDDWMLVLRRK